MKQHLLAVIAIGLSLAGCCSQTSSKPTLQRGWIGGEFKTTKHKLPSNDQRHIYVKQVYADTPAEQAGLKPGDVILKVNEHSVKDLKEFYSLIDVATPGSRATIQVLRSGESLDVPVTIGREAYHQWHTIQLGLHLSSKLDLWPDPDFTLAPVAHYDRVEERVELKSPEVVLAQHDKDSSGERGVRSREGWNVWLAIFGADAHKRILKQEVVPAASAESRPVRRADATRQ